MRSKRTDLCRQGCRGRFFKTEFS